jgi:hypothetical protein
VPNPDISGEKRVRVAQRAHRNVGRRPWPDPGNVQQLAQHRRGIRAGIQAHPIALDQQRQRAQRLAALARERHLGRVGLG